MPYNALVFTVTDMMESQLHDKDWSTATKRGLAGAFAGGLGLTMNTPIEFMKCRAQATTTGQLRY